jgi:hypothetical protein
LSIGNSSFQCLQLVLQYCGDVHLHQISACKC